MCEWTDRAVSPLFNQNFDFWYKMIPRCLYNVDNELRILIEYLINISISIAWKSAFDIILFTSSIFALLYINIKQGV